MKPKFCILLSLLPLAASAQTTFEDAFAHARQHRPTVKAAELRLAQAHQARRSLSAFPGMNLSLGYSNDARVGGNDDDLVLTQPLDVFGRSAAGRATGDALVAQAESALRQTLADLQNDVATLYAEAAAVQERVRIAREAEAAGERLLQAVRSLVEGGKLPGVQATRVSIELERLKATRELREAEAEAALRRLAAAAGVSAIRVGGFPTLAANVVSIDQRPDLLLLRAEVQAAEANIRQERADAMPQLELQGRRSSWHEDSTYGARLQLNFPLFSPGRKATNEAAKSRLEAAKRSLEDAEQIARVEVEAAQVEAKASAAKLASLELVLRKTGDLIQRTETGLREGVSTLLDVLDAQRARREIEEDIVEAKLAFSLAQAKLLKATGEVKR